MDEIEKQLNELEKKMGDCAIPFGHKFEYETAAGSSRERHVIIKGLSKREVLVTLLMQNQLLHLENWSSVIAEEKIARCFIIADEILKQEKTKKNEEFLASDRNNSD